MPGHFISQAERDEYARERRERDPKVQARKKIDAALPALIDKLIEQATEHGCLKSQAMLLSKGIAQLKPTDAPITPTFNLIDTTLPVKDQLSRVVELMFTGVITQEQAANLSNIMGHMLRADQHEELTKDLEAALLDMKKLMGKKKNKPFN